MDITVDINDYTLNMRAAGIIIHNNKILLHRNLNSDHYALIGGRVMIGESSDNTVKREMLEELGKEVETYDYVATIENFFTMKKSKYHEIMFIYNADFIKPSDKKIEYLLKNREGKEYLQYEWIDLDKINEYKILPVCIKEILKSTKYPIHIINDELKNKI